VTTRLTRIPSWKQQADFLFVQIAFDVDERAKAREVHHPSRSVGALRADLPLPAVGSRRWDNSTARWR
jgi:hypothetical protein